MTVPTVITRHTPLHSTAASPFCVSTPATLLPWAAPLPRSAGWRRRQAVHLIFPHSSRSSSTVLKESQNSEQVESRRSAVPSGERGCFLRTGRTTAQRGCAEEGSSNISYLTVGYCLNCKSNFLWKNSQPPRKTRWKANGRRGGERALHSHKRM